MHRKTLAVSALGLLCLLGLLSFFGFLRWHDSEAQKGSVCWPLHFSGITLGITDDAQVQRLLGTGVFRKAHRDTGGRYFIDTKRSATLYVVTYTDFVVGEVTLQAGIDPAIKHDDQDLAVTRWFSSEDGFGNGHALHLGSSKDDVLKNLGEPKRRYTSNSWMWETRCTCDIPESFNIFFQNERVAKVVFSAPG